MSTEQVRNRRPNSVSGVVISLFEQQFAARSIVYSNTDYGTVWVATWPHSGATRFEAKLSGKPEAQTVTFADLAAALRYIGLPEY